MLKTLKYYSPSYNCLLQFHRLVHGFSITHVHQEICLYVTLILFFMVITIAWMFINFDSHAFPICQGPSMHAVRPSFLWCVAMEWFPLLWSSRTYVWPRTLCLISPYCIYPRISPHLALLYRTISSPHPFSSPMFSIVAHLIIYFLSSLYFIEYSPTYRHNITTKPYQTSLCIPPYVSISSYEHHTDIHISNTMIPAILPKVCFPQKDITSWCEKLYNTDPSNFITMY
jgi:hypothetical protein